LILGDDGFSQEREGIEKQKTEMLMGFVAGRSGKGFEGGLGESEKLLAVYTYSKTSDSSSK